tara:strand:+ start:1244 stop:1345 length:102 start_codon:yes stop_codon:yes gene_type:complete
MAVNEMKRLEIQGFFALVEVWGRIGFKKNFLAN